MMSHQIHFGQTGAIHAVRQITRHAAFLSTPEQLVRQPPKLPKIPTAAGSNPPKKTEPAEA